MLLLWKCQDCGWHGSDEEIISFADPVLEGNIWSICPECRAAEQFDNMCDEPECKQLATCGWPSTESYRRTCFEHSSFNKKREA